MMREEWQFFNRNSLFYCIIWKFGKRISIEQMKRVQHFFFRVK